MTRQRKEKNEKDVKIKLKKPDRSGPDPSLQTLIQLAEQRRLFIEADKRNGITAKDEEALVGRLGEAVLWSFSLSMLHFTLDVFVSHQYAVDIEWPVLVSRAAQAFPSKLNLSMLEVQY